MPKQIIVIGRGHSGTRIPIDVFQESGIYCGNTSGSGDHRPPQPMYKAARWFGQYVEVYEDWEWDFSTVLNMPPVKLYRQLVHQYLYDFRALKLYAWKLPEATLSLPWLVQMFPEAYYIHWVRDGRDNILRWHGTEDDWYGVPLPQELPEDRMLRAALSWDYHEELIAQTPKPTRWLRVRLEDFVTDQAYELERMAEFLGEALAEVYVNPNVCGRYLDYDMITYMPILERHLEAHGYLAEDIYQS